VSSYQQEFISSVKNDITDLLHKDWSEIEHRKDIRPFNPDWDAYEALEQANMLKIFTVRENDRLVGYHVNIVAPSLHSKGVSQASADVVYLHPDYRKGFTGYKLFKFAEKCLKEDGVNILHLTATEANPIGPLMSKLQYDKIETKYEKVL